MPLYFVFPACWLAEARWLDKDSVHILPSGGGRLPEGPCHPLLAKRGVRKEAQDRWFRLLGPEPALIKAWKSGSIGWDEFRERYLAEYSSAEKKAALDELSALVKGAGGDVTLLCTCMEESVCHRKILKDLLTCKQKP